MGGSARDHTLRKLAGQRVFHALCDVGRSGHAHRLVNVAAAAQRVADGSAETGGRSAERLDLRGVVVGLVLELQQPFLGLAVHVHIHVDGAGIVFLALLQVVEFAVGTEPARSDGGEVHQAEGLLFTSKLAAHLFPHRQSLLQLVADKRVLHGDVGKQRGKGGVTAVVAPVCVEDTEFRFVGVAAFGLEIGHHLHEVVAVHGQTHGAAVFRCRRGSDFPQPFKHLHRVGMRAFRKMQDLEVLASRLDGVDAIFRHTLDVGRGDGGVESHQPCRRYLHLGIRLQKPHAFARRSRTLVELSRKGLVGKVRCPRKIHRIADLVGGYLPEHAPACLFEKFRREAEQVIDGKQSQFLYVKAEI